MKINRYITRGISEQLSLDLQILLWNMVKDRDNQLNTDYLHIFKLQEDDNMLSITHEQEQPAYKLEYHYTCLLYTSPSPRDQRGSRMPSSA